MISVYKYAAKSLRTLCSALQRRYYLCESVRAVSLRIVYIAPCGPYKRELIRMRKAMYLVHCRNNHFSVLFAFALGLLSGNMVSLYCIVVCWAVYANKFAFFVILLARMLLYYYCVRCWLGCYIESKNVCVRIRESYVCSVKEDNKYGEFFSSLIDLTGYINLYFGAYWSYFNKTVLKLFIIIFKPWNVLTTYVYKIELRTTHNHKSYLVGNGVR